MKEASYNATFAAKIEKEIGGQVYKMADVASLGRPDSFHIMDKIVTFFETKIDNDTKAVSLHDGKISCRPWDAINDMRQYEVCRRYNRCATVLYVIYYPNACMTALIPLDLLEKYNRRRHADCLYWLQKGFYFVNGHGVDAFERILLQKRKELYDKLRTETFL